MKTGFDRFFSFDSASVGGHLPLLNAARMLIIIIVIGAVEFSIPIITIINIIILISTRSSISIVIVITNHPYLYQCTINKHLYMEQKPTFITIIIFPLPFYLHAYTQYP